MDDVATEVDLHVDVHGTALVPPWVDRTEEREPLCIRALDPAHEGATGGAGTEA